MTCANCFDAVNIFDRKVGTSLILMATFGFLSKSDLRSQKFKADVTVQCVKDLCASVSAPHSRVRYRNETSELPGPTT